MARYDWEFGYGREDRIPTYPASERTPIRETDYGARGWPYQRGYEQTRRTRGRRDYDWELRPERGRGGYGPGPRVPSPRMRPGPAYDFEYGGRPVPGYGRVQSGRFGGRERPEPRFGEPGGRTRRRGGELAQGGPPGRSPTSRWPDRGHDLGSARRGGPSDEEIRHAVQENLFQDSWVDPRGIDVEVDGGVVRLTGEVRDFMEARYVWDDAWESEGVRGVIDNLTVRTDVPQDDSEMPQTGG